MSLLASLFAKISRPSLGWAILTLCLVSLCPCVLAQPQTFATQQRGGGQEFAYSYATTDGKRQTLTVRLNLDDITRGSAEFQPWSHEGAKLAGTKAVQQAAKAYEKPDLQIMIDPMPGGTSYRARGTNPLLANPQYLEDLQKNLEPAYDAAELAYARRHYYRIIQPGQGFNKGNTKAIMPDHAAIAKRYTAAMGPVATAILTQVPGANASPRAFINAALNWLQTIPYDTLNNRSTSNGAGFQTPYGLMLGNLGDCDTKATALAALIRAAYPQIPVAIVYVPDHAFIAIGLPQESRDYALQTEHGTFILADATGPGLTPLGYIDEPTRAKIRANQTDLSLIK